MTHIRNYRYWIGRKCKRLTIKAAADSNSEWNAGIKRYRLNLEPAEFQPVDEGLEEPPEPETTPAEVQAAKWKRHAAAANFGSNTAAEPTIPAKRSKLDLSNLEEKRPTGACTDHMPLLMTVESTPSSCSVGRSRPGGLNTSSKRPKLCVQHTSSECFTLDDSTDRDIEELREMLELDKDGLPVM